MGYAGMDTSIYPGDVVMDDLIENTNLVWCGFYLGPAPSHPDPSWMGQRARLVKTGWGLAPIYVGQQEPGGPGSHKLTAAQGRLDGDDACSLAKGAGFPTSSLIYLDIEAPAPLTQPTSDYLAQWHEVVTALDYRAGVYCSHHVVAAIAGLGLDLRYWVYKISNADNGGTKQQPFKDDDPPTIAGVDTTAWQWTQNCIIKTVNGDITVDLDTAATSNPSLP